MHGDARSLTTTCGYPLLRWSSPRRPYRRSTRKPTGGRHARCVRDRFVAREHERIEQDCPSAPWQGSSMRGEPLNVGFSDAQAGSSIGASTRRARRRRALPRSSRGASRWRSRSPTVAGRAMLGPVRPNEKPRPPREARGSFDGVRRPQRRAPRRASEARALRARTWRGERRGFRPRREGNREVPLTTKARP